LIAGKRDGSRHRTASVNHAGQSWNRGNNPSENKQNEEKKGGKMTETRKTLNINKRRCKMILLGRCPGKRVVRRSVYRHLDTVLDKAMAEVAGRQSAESKEINWL